jgi:hypothetical protein
MVNSYGWITAAQAIDGFALAETTPGPLIMVLQFIGFMTGWNQGGVACRRLRFVDDFCHLSSFVYVYFYRRALYRKIAR